MPSVSDRALLFWIVVVLIAFLLTPLVLNSKPRPVTNAVAPPVAPFPTARALVVPSSLPMLPVPPS